MINTYYIQRGAEVAKDIYADFGVIVKQTKGLGLIPALKKVHSRDWPDEQGEDVYLPDDAKFKSKTVDLTFYISNSNVDDVNLTMRNFILYLLARGDFSYFDTYKKKGFRGYYKKSTVGGEIYRDAYGNIEFTLSFSVPNGICYAFDNTSGTSMSIEISKGEVDVYFSDGYRRIGEDSDFIHNQIGGFAIVCPTVLDGSNVNSRDNIIMGIDYKTFGVVGDTENIKFGI